MADRINPPRPSPFSRNFSKENSKVEQSSEESTGEPSVESSTSVSNPDEDIFQSPFAARATKKEAKQLPRRPSSAAPPLSPRSPRLQSPRGSATPPSATSPSQQPGISAADARTYLEGWVKHEFSSAAVDKTIFRENPSLTLNGKPCSIQEFMEACWGTILRDSEIGRAWTECRAEVLALETLTEDADGKQVLTAAATQVAEKLMNKIRGTDQSLASSALPAEVKEFLLYADTLVKDACEEKRLGDASLVTRKKALTGLLFTRMLSVIWAKDLLQGGAIALFLGRVNSSLSRDSEDFTLSIMHSADQDSKKIKQGRRMQKIRHSRMKSDTSSDPISNPMLARAKTNQLLKDAMTGLSLNRDAQKALRGELLAICKASPDIDLAELKEKAQEQAQRLLAATVPDSSSAGSKSSSPEKSS